MELDVFLSLIYTGVLWLIKSDDLFTLALPMNGLTILLFIMAFINEKIQTKLETIYEAIYGLPWYSYKVEEQKLCLMVLQCNQVKMGLTVSGFHQLSLERFSNIMQQAYSNILVLKKLLEIQK